VKDLHSGFHTHKTACPAAHGSLRYWGLMASKGLSGAAPVLEGYGLSCEHDLSLLVLVQEDLNALSSQLTPFHSRILRTWVQGLAAADQHHKRDKKRAAGDVNDAPAAKKHSNAPPSAEIKEQEGTKHIVKEDEDEDEKEEDEDKDDTGDEDEDEDEDEDSDEGDEEASCGAAGEQEGVGDGKSPQLLPSGTSLQHVQCHFWRGSERGLRGLP
jgi:hypothetical protein